MTVLETAIVRAQKLRPRTKALYLQHVRAFLDFAGEEWTTDKARAWRDDMRSRRIRPQSVNVAVNALRFAARRTDQTFVDAIETLPVRQSAARAKKAERTLTLDEGRRLVQECRRPGDPPRGIRDCALVLLGLRTGMLRFSVCQLRFEDLKLNRKKPTLTFVKKGGAAHTILLDPVTLAALTDWIAWLKLNDVTSGFVFRSLGRARVVSGQSVSIGDRLTPDGLYRALQQRATNANLQDLSPHAFSRSFVEWAKKAGAQPSQIAAVTGHKPDGADKAGFDAENALPANFLIPNFED
jgi:integrase